MSIIVSAVPTSTSAVESALFRLRVSDVELPAKARSARETKAVAASASRREMPRVARPLVDRCPTEHIDGHRLCSRSGHRDRNIGIGCEHPARVEDRIAGVDGPEHRAVRELLGRAVRDEAAGRLFPLEYVASRRRIEVDPEAFVAGDGALARELEVSDDLMGRPGEGV